MKAVLTRVRSASVSIDGELLTARTEGGRLVRMSGPDCLLGQFADAKITGCTTWSLTGESVL